MTLSLERREKRFINEMTKAARGNFANRITSVCCLEGARVKVDLRTDLQGRRAHGINVYER